MLALPHQMKWNLNSPFYDDEHNTAEYHAPLHEGDTPDISVAKGKESNLDVIHEMGHAASWERGTKHRTYGVPAKRGEEEGYAENHAQTHYREPGYKGRGMPGINWEDAFDESGGWSVREKTDSAQAAFTNAYISKRMSHPANAVSELNPEQFNYHEYPLLHKETPPRGSGLPTGWTYNPNAVSHEY
jgi:hypothetical protein